MTIEPEWRKVSMSSVWREESELSVAPEDELSWPGPRTTTAMCSVRMATFMRGETTLEANSATEIPLTPRA